jgi:hypothetical protein
VHKVIQESQVHEVLQVHQETRESWDFLNKKNY